MSSMNPSHVRAYTTAAEVEHPAATARLLPLFLLALVGAIVLLLAGSRPALADGPDDGDVVVRDDDADDDDADDDDDDLDDDVDPDDLVTDGSRGTTAADASGVTSVTA